MGPDGPRPAGLAAVVAGVVVWRGLPTMVWGASPGQRLLGLRIVDAGSALRASPTRALARSIVLGVELAAVGLSLALLVVVLLDVAVIAERRRSLADRLSGAAVVRV